MCMLAVAMETSAFDMNTMEADTFMIKETPIMRGFPNQNTSLNLLDDQLTRGTRSDDLYIITTLATKSVNTSLTDGVLLSPETGGNRSVHPLSLKQLAGPRKYG